MPPHWYLSHLLSPGAHYPLHSHLYSTGVGVAGLLGERLGTHLGSWIGWQDGWTVHQLREEQGAPGGLFTRARALLSLPNPWLIFFSFEMEPPLPGSRVTS